MAAMGVAFCWGPSLVSFWPIGWTPASNRNCLAVSMLIDSPEGPPPPCRCRPTIMPRTGKAVSDERDRDRQTPLHDQDRVGLLDPERPDHHWRSEAWGPPAFDGACAR